MTGAAPATARLFIAVWPAPAARRDLQAWLRQWTWPTGAAVVAAARMHLTLHFLAQVPLARLAALQAALPAAAAGLAPFEIEFDRIERWPRGLVVFGAAETPAALLRLHGALSALLEDLALPLEARPYHPHVTLARRAAAAVEPAAAPALRWPVDHYALVHSERGYHELERVALRG